MKWPWPRDSREERAKRIALSYRRVLELLIAGEIADPTTALAGLDARWLELGQGWIRPTNQPLRLDDWLTGREMAELFSQDPHTIYMWARRGRIGVATTFGERRYRVGDVVEYQRARAARRTGATVSTGGPRP